MIGPWLSALEEQQSDVINQDTIHAFNRHLQIAELRGKATIAVDTRAGGLRHTLIALRQPSLASLTSDLLHCYGC